MLEDCCCNLLLAMLVELCRLPVDAVTCLLVAQVGTSVLCSRQLLFSSTNLALPCYMCLLTRKMWKMWQTRVCMCTRQPSHCKCMCFTFLGACQAAACQGNNYVTAALHLQLLAVVNDQFSLLHATQQAIQLHEPLTCTTLADTPMSPLP